LKNYLLFSILISFIVSGCFSKESIFDKASIDPSDVPKIIAYDPHEALTEIPENTIISVLFSLPMNRPSVEEAFHFRYNGREYHISDGSYEWSHNDRLFSFRPVPSIPNGTMVTVTIHHSAQSNEGIRLEEMYEWDFEVSTEEYTGNPNVSGCLPSLDTVILTDIPISITFDREMLRSTVEASFSLLSDDLLDYRSADDGTITWTNRTMTFQTNEPLDYDKYYTMLLNDHGIICTDLSGNELAGFQSQFFTSDNEIYVSQNIGSDSDPGYHSSLPVATIQQGIANALNNGFTHVKIAQGTYTADITLDADNYHDFHFQGGWDQNFSNPDADPSSYIADVSPGLNNFTFTLSDVSGVIIDGLKINGGNAAGPNNGSVLINSGSSEITIQNCSIEGGNAGTTHGILIGTGAQNIVIQDNPLIYGGTTVDNDTYGILVENGAVAHIYRNTIHGGEDTGSAYNTHIGVGFSAAGDCNLFNNFIVGGADVTDTQNDSYGVYVVDSDVDIINNTIDGLGNVGAPAITHGIYGENTDSNIINNIIIGGRGVDRYGITLSSYNTLINDVLIFFNTFDRDGCLDGFLNDASGTVVPPFTTIASMESGYNTVLRLPSGNNDYLPGDIVFFGPLIGDFTVDTGLSANVSLIEHNGYNSLSSMLTTAEMQEVTRDRFWTDRPVSFIDRGAHEFNPEN
jgi:hypothetical protein